ncbi:MAG: ABC transporter substrate-binding protein, partial [Chloroflexota bacterium]
MFTSLLRARHGRLALRRFMTAASLALAVLLLTVAMPMSTFTPAASAQAPLKVRMSVLPIFISAPIFIAQDKGYFAEAGIDLEMTTLWQASEIIAGFASDSLDASAGGFGP